MEPLWKDHFYYKSEWKGRLYFTCHTPNFLKEVASNPEMRFLTQPFNILRELLVEVAERASQLNDPVLNALMCDLTLYGCADPADKENYDPKLVEQVYKEAYEYLQKAKKQKSLP